MDTYNGILSQPSSKQRLVSNKWVITISLIILALVTWVLTYISANNPQIVERLYSSSIYPYIGMSLSFINNLFPISLAEILLIMLVLFTFVAIVLLIIKPKLYLNNLNNILHIVLRSLALIYILFYFLWGFNYFREDYMELANMNKEPGTIEELKELSLEIIEKLNNVRKNLIDDNNGMPFIKESFQEISELAEKGFEDYNVGKVSLDGNYGQAKPVLLSEYMSYTGIMGIYFPFTAEPNVNRDIPSQDLLSTITHEMAHQRGFAKEEEANFIAYKANINNPDERFQYSGYYLAIQYLLKELYLEDKEAYFLLYTKLSDAVIRDMDFSRDYWNSKEGKTEEIVTTMNDTYLKANNQEEGIRSYNEVVRLLLSEYKDSKDN